MTEVSVPGYLRYVGFIGFLVAQGYNEGWEEDRTYVHHTPPSTPGPNGVVIEPLDQGAWRYYNIFYQPSAGYDSVPTTRPDLQAYWHAPPSGWGHKLSGFPDFPITFDNVGWPDYYYGDPLNIGGYSNGTVDRHNRPTDGGVLIFPEV